MDFIGSRSDLYSLVIDAKGIGKFRGQALLVNSPPQVVLLAVNFDENFIDVERVAIASVFSLQAAGINGTEFDAPKTDCFATDSDTSFSE